MKVRVKFKKEGPMKFIGHLDMMRYFQKAIRRADIDIAYSEGYSPHMILSFAAPLGVGSTSTGEYFDMEVKTALSSAEMKNRFNQTMVDGIEVLSARQVADEKASKAMSLVAAADYIVTYRENKQPCEDWEEKLLEFYKQPSIVILKKTKKSEREMDIRPFIYDLQVKEKQIFMKLAAGSVNNIKPELVMQAFSIYLGQELENFSLMLHRQEVYADVGTNGEIILRTLEELGEEIE